MKSYFIFAIILTAIYVVYYAANIARDLYRKRSQGRTDEEVFELDPDDGQRGGDGKRDRIQRRDGEVRDRI